MSVHAQVFVSVPVCVPVINFFGSHSESGHLGESSFHLREMKHKFNSISTLDRWQKAF